MQSYHDYLKPLFSRLQGYAKRYWYPPLFAVLAALDAFLVVIPTDGLLVSSSLAVPRRWVLHGFCAALGSTIGAFILAYLARQYGLPWVEQSYPDIVSSETWKSLDGSMIQYGLWFVFLYSATPLPQQPMILLAGLSHLSLPFVSWAMFIGRLIKFLLMSYAGAKAPWLLNRLWGIKDDLKDVGIEPTTNSKN